MTGNPTTHALAKSLTALTGAAVGIALVTTPLVLGGLGAADSASTELQARCHLIVALTLLVGGLAVVARRGRETDPIRGVLGIASLGGMALVAVLLLDAEPFTRPGSLINPLTSIALAGAALAFLIRAAGAASGPGRFARNDTIAFWGSGGLLLGAAALLQADPQLLGPGSKSSVALLGLVVLGTLAAYWHGRYRAGRLPVGRTSVQTVAVALALLVSAGLMDWVGGVAEYAEETCEFAAAVLLLAAAIPLGHASPSRTSPVNWTQPQQAALALAVLAVLFLILGSPLAVQDTLASPS